MHVLDALSSLPAQRLNAYPANRAHAALCSACHVAHLPSTALETSLGVSQQQVRKVRRDLMEILMEIKACLPIAREVQDEQVLGFALELFAWRNRLLRAGVWEGLEGWVADHGKQE